ncbi:MAG: hypothetical protein J7483_08915 [Novosphingobium sp.]|nr:hypothetical protein [Novosphingobium sp.]
MSRPRRSPYRIPAALALATGAGLLLALLDDGIYDAIAALCLAAPLVPVGWALARR